MFNDDELLPEAPRYGTSYVVGRDGSWVLLFQPPVEYCPKNLTGGDLVWLDLAYREESAEPSSGPFSDDASPGASPDGG